MNHTTQKLVGKKTKIIATYGPACADPDVIRQLIINGVDLFRLNASHEADKETLQAIVDKIRHEAQRLGSLVGIFLDLQGPKIRVGRFEPGQHSLQDNQDVQMTTRTVLGNQRLFQVDYPHFCSDVAIGDPIYINDGKIKGVIKEVGSDTVTCHITSGGEISNNKGVNLPCTQLSMPAFTDKDKVDAKTAIEIGCDYVALSFVSNEYDLIAFRQFLAEHGGSGLHVISKIERQQAVDNLDGILKQSDAIMVARGDLGVEVGIERVPKLQKQIIQECARSIKPVIVATQMLESMIEETVATRAEVSDIANAIYDHCDAVMLSAETAVGINPPQVIKVMSNICTATDNDVCDRRKNVATRSKHIFHYNTTATSFCRAADQIAEENNARAIMVFTSSGNTPLIASKLSSLFPIIAPTDCVSICNKLSLYRGVTPLMMPKRFLDIHRWTDMISLAVKESVRLEWLKTGDCLVVTAGIPIGQSNGINSIRIITV